MLLAIVFVVTAVVGIPIQYFAGESSQFDLLVFLSPFFFIALPMLALTAAFAVLFEYIGFLCGGFGNIVYFFFFGFVITLACRWGRTIQRSTQSASVFSAIVWVKPRKPFFPTIAGASLLGSTGAPIMGTFPWAGVDLAEFGIIATRLMFLGIGIMTAFVSYPLF